MEIGPNNHQHNIASFHFTKQIKRRKNYPKKISMTSKKSNKHNKGWKKTSKQQNKKSMKLLKQYCVEAFNIHDKDIFDNIIEIEHECFVCQEQYPLYRLKPFNKIQCVSCKTYLKPFFDPTIRDFDLRPNHICTYCCIYYDICSKKYISPYCSCTSCNYSDIFGRYLIKCASCHDPFCKRCISKGKCHDCGKYEIQQKHTKAGIRLLKEIKHKMCNEKNRYNNIMRKQRKNVFKLTFNQLSDIFGGYDDLVNLILDYLCKYEDFVKDITYNVSCCGYQCGRRFVKQFVNYSRGCCCGFCGSYRVINKFKGYTVQNKKPTRMFVMKGDDELYCMENGVQKEANYFQLNDKYVKEILKISVAINTIGIRKIANGYFRIFCQDCKDKYMYKFGTKCTKYECKNKDVTKYCRIHYKLEQMHMNIEWDDRHIIVENYNANQSSVHGWKGGFYWDNKSTNYNQHLIINPKRSIIEYSKKMCKKQKMRRRKNNIGRNSHAKRRLDKKMNVKSCKKANKIYLRSLKQF